MGHERRICNANVSTFTYLLRHIINADVDGSGVFVLLEEGVGDGFVRGGGPEEVMPLPLVLAITSIC